VNVRYILFLLDLDSERKISRPCRFILDPSFSLSVSLQATTTLGSFILLVVALIIYSKPYYTPSVLKYKMF
jgi:hypothetical protein